MEVQRTIHLKNKIAIVPDYTILKNYFALYNGKILIRKEKKTNKTTKSLKNTNNKQKKRRKVRRRMAIKQK